MPALDVAAALEAAKSKYPTTVVTRDVDIEVDVGNLTAMDPTPTDDVLVDAGSELSEKLRELARDTAQVLINNIWELPTERSTLGVTARLPRPTTSLPREKAVPEMKRKTKWERFAEEKGIKAKAKRGRMVFDDASQEYKPRFGYKSKQSEEPWLIEVPANAPDNEDQYEKLREAKRERVTKNTKAQLRNQGKKAAVPINTANASKTEQKKNIEAKMIVSKTSTASLGRFDKKLKGEPKLKLREKRKFDANEDVSNEKSRNKGLLSKLFDSQQGTVDVSKGVNKTLNKMKYEEAQLERSKKRPRKK